jgi:hypothetical protein
MTGFDAYGCGVQGASSEVLDVSSTEALTLDARMGQARLARTLSGLAALVGHILPARPLDPTRRTIPTRVRVQKQSNQYVSFDYTQTLTDHRVLQSVGSVGDAYDKELVSHCTSLG